MIIADQKERPVAVIMKHLGLSPEEGAFVYDALRGGWAVDGKPTTAAMRLEFELDQREMGLKEKPSPSRSTISRCLKKPGNDSPRTISLSCQKGGFPP
jgi:hypothetical protein